jgi:hypothetical protein
MADFAIAVTGDPPRGSPMPGELGPCRPGQPAAARIHRKKLLLALTPEEKAGCRRPGMWPEYPQAVQRWRHDTSCRFPTSAAGVAGFWDRLKVATTDVRSSGCRTSPATVDEEERANSAWFDDRISSG